MSRSPTAISILESIECAGFSLTLELRGTSQKWITGKNLFMGIVDHHGIAVSGPYGPVAMEMPLRVGAHLVWVGASGEHLVGYTKALRNTIMSGEVRPNSHLYRAMVALAPLARRKVS